MMIVNPALRYELLTFSDATHLAEVAVRAYSDHYLHLWHDAGAWYLARSFTPEGLGRELNNPIARFYLIYLDDEPVGFLKLNLHQPSPCDPTLNALELERIYLQKEATGRGIGTSTVQFVVEQARELDKQLIWLKAMASSHDAIAFYQRMGFVLCGTSRLPYEMMREGFRQMVSLQKQL